MPSVRPDLDLTAGLAAADDRLTFVTPVPAHIKVDFAYTAPNPSGRFYIKVRGQGDEPDRTVASGLSRSLADDGVRAINEALATWFG